MKSRVVKYRFVGEFYKKKKKNKGENMKADFC